MQEQIITIFYLCDELVQAVGIREDPQVKMTTAEVMTVALTAASFFGGNFETSRKFLQEHGYIPDMVSKSRFNRRLHALGESVWQMLFSLLAEVFKQTNAENEYVLDSFPVPVCDNIRISRSKIYQGEAYRGYIASKRRYFYGLRVHMLITATGQPVEFLLAPGASHDAKILKQFTFDLPPNAVVNGDKAYNDYGYEALLHEAVSILLQPLRKKNSKRPFEPWIRFWQERVRKRVETTFSVMTQGFPKVIHAVTAPGFELKVVLFILAFAIQCL
jgi:hypothetical protein